jgi:hypothetical protein
VTLDHVAAWRDFTDVLASAGDALAWEGLELDDLDRAEGLRYLARLAANAVAGRLGVASPTHPAFEQLANGVGMDNPDNHYLASPINPRFAYRITGRKGQLSYLSFAAQSQNFADTSSITGGAGQLHGGQLDVDGDGRFTIIASTAEQPGNWLRLAPDSRLLLVRQTRADPAVEQWVEVDIECIDHDGPPPPLEPGKVPQRLSGVALYAGGAAAWFTDWVRPWLDRPNTFAFADPDEQQRIGGDPNIIAQSGYWSIGPDEALLVELTPPPCAYWNIQLANVWAESLDTRRPVWRNNTSVVAERDGSVRLVIAHRDPGHPNWLDTAGHRHGTAHIRYVLPESRPPARTTLVPLREVASLLS